MRRLFLNACLWILGFLILLSCSTFDVRNRLNDIESYIMDRPDSALAVLDMMDRSLLTTERLRAHHALLHAMALDKNYIDVTDDSIARIAVDYYSRKGPKKYEARALYYLGVAYYYQGAYNKSILELTRAEKIASECDSLYCGLVKLMQSNAYNATYNDFQELKYAQEAFHIFNSISADYYSKVAKLSMSRAYYNLNKIEKSEEILLELLSDTTYNNILISSKILYAFTQAVEYKNYDEASSLYDQVYHSGNSLYMSNEDYWAWVYSLNEIGKNECSQSLVNHLKSDTSATSYYWQYMIAKSDGKVDEALYLLEKTSTKNNYEVEEALKQSLSSVQRDFYISQSEISEYKAQNRKLLLMITIITSILFITAILWSVLIYVKKREEEKESYLKYADEIHRQLENAKNEDYPELKRKYMALYQSRFETIGALYEQYSLSHGKKNEEKAIYDKVVALVDEFRHDYQDIERFESILDDDMDNIISDLRSEMSGFKDVDFAIFRFSLIGFDVTVISHLMNMSMNAIYIRKSRMRKQIENVNPVRKDEYLEILDLKSPFKEKS
ncbi:MAG: hypothetical protein E7124_06325 [Bacteroidales bacterium]|nr:hypothetical protein [Bacteroidales bacterium]